MYYNNISNIIILLKSVSVYLFLKTIREEKNEFCTLHKLSEYLKT